MVQEVRSRELDERIGRPICRDSVLDEDLPEYDPRDLRRLRSLRQRRHLAGADWLNAPPVRRSANRPEAANGRSADGSGPVEGDRHRR